MRTIKFRGKHLCGQWYYGNLIIRETDSPVPETLCSYKCVMIGDVDDGSEEEVEEDTVGQFTGLTDKNGKEIYEGDIVQVKSLKGVVTWHPEGYFCIHTQKCDIAETSYNAIGDLVDWLHREHYAEGLEIIGNIHDLNLLENESNTTKTNTTNK